MKLVKIILVVIFSFSLVLPNFGQDNSATPQRTPEQEAAKQTEKLQQELDLSQEQTKQIYEVNLKYARERQISNTRSEAMERMKNKNADIERILNAEQNNRLQSKRYERSVYDNPTNRSLPAGASGLRSTEYRSNPIQRTPSTDNTLRNSYRPSTREYTRPSSEQPQRQSSPPSRTPNSNNYQPPRRSSSSDYYSAPRRSESVPSRQSAPSSGSRRTEPSTSSGRR